MVLCDNELPVAREQVVEMSMCRLNIINSSHRGFISVRSTKYGTSSYL
jgi:hypothetical protein